MAKFTAANKLTFRFLEFKSVKLKVNKELKKLIPTNGTLPERLKEAVWYTLNSGGKRFRPYLAVTSCKSVGGDINKVTKVSVACELFHTVSLIQDDIIDNDVLRRGKKTLHRKYGTPVAILAADYLFGKAFEEISSCSEVIPNRKVIDLLSLFSLTCADACSGEVFDMDFSYDKFIDIDFYIKVVENKTAKLIEAVTRAGAICGNGSKQQIDNVGSYGYNLGVAYQIVDDILNIKSSNEELGKSILQDIKKKRPNAVLVLTVKSLHPTLKKELLTILNKNKKTEVEQNKVLEIIKHTNAEKEAFKLARSYIKKACSSIKILDNTQAKDTLKQIANFVLERNN